MSDAVHRKGVEPNFFFHHLTSRRTRHTKARPERPAAPEVVAFRLALARQIPRSDLHSAAHADFSEAGNIDEPGKHG
jgi:hypothetical protein